MAYEIDYLPVGDGERGGDAIAMRFGNLLGPREEQTVIVIDGGNKESGDALVEHITLYYRTDRVDFVISTHPDSDHASGLYTVLEKLRVGTLMMHKPWEYAEDIVALIDDNRVTENGTEKRLRDALKFAKDLENLANKKSIHIAEPFAGLKNENQSIYVLGPSSDYYLSLLPDFLQQRVYGQKSSDAETVLVPDAPHIDHLDDENDSTSPRNLSSVIVLFTIEGHKLLFTGDAGKRSLHLAADYAKSQGITLNDLTFFDVPHHGSKRNISSGLLKRVCGTTAYISTPKDSIKHPSKKVTNGLKKHGANVFITRGRGICYSNNAPVRAGWGVIQDEPFHPYVEE